MSKYVASILLLLSGVCWATSQEPRYIDLASSTPREVAVLPIPHCLPPASTIADGPTTIPALVCPPMVCCPAEPRIWASAEWLTWWIRDASLPPVATTTSALAEPRRGAIDLPTTTILYGGDRVRFDDLTGGRFTLGSWLDDERTWGLEGSGFVLERETTGFRAGALEIGTPPLFVPAYRAELGVEGSFIISDVTFPAAGVLEIRLNTQMWGAEINALRNIARGDGYYVDVLAGFRYLDLEENFNLYALVVGNGEPFSVALSDHFRTANQFYGGQIGTRMGVRRGRVGLDLTAKLALGNTHQVVAINGVIDQSGTFAAANGQLGVFPGGIFSQPSNIGLHSRDRFTVVPEVQVKLSYHLTQQWNAFFTYNFLYWSNVVRPGDQIDRNVNKTQQGGGTLVGPALPAPRIEDTGFWAQGIGLGLEYRY